MKKIYQKQLQSLQEIFGANLRELRTSHKLTLEELAHKIKISYQSLSDLERGKSFPSKQSLINIAFCFQIQAYELLIDKRYLDRNNKEKDKIINLLNNIDNKYLPIIYEMVLGFKKLTDIK